MSIPPKPLHLVHIAFGLVAFIPLLLIVPAVLLPHFQDEERSRIEALQDRLRVKLEGYHKDQGRYPDSLQALALTNSPWGIPSQRDIQKVSYISHHFHHFTESDGLMMNFVTQACPIGKKVWLA